MKIICIEGNYKSSSKIPTSLPGFPVFFMKPESSVLRNKMPFFIPEHTQKIIPKVNIVLKICKLGKNIQEKFAHNYYQDIGIGLDMEAADTIKTCKENGLPWEPAKAYDSSAPVGNFVSKKKFETLNNIPFSLLRNNKIIIHANTSEMIYSFDKIIENISKYITLKTGDYIFTGSPEINESININNKIECFIQENKLLSFNIK